MDIQLKKKPLWIRYKYSILAGILFTAFLIYLIIASWGPQRIRYDRDKLTIAEVREAKFMEYLDIEGVVQPKLTVKLNSIEGGSVERIVAENGSLLKTGDTILALTNPELLRAIEDERDELSKQQISYREKQIQMERKSSELKRQTLETIYKLDRLSKENTLNQEEYNIGIKSKAQYEVTLDEFLFNQENTRLLLEELKHDSLLNIIQSNLMYNDLKREEKRFERNLDRLNNLIVRAPFDGQLSFVSVIPGERLSAGSNIGELKIVDQVKLCARVNEYYIDRIATGLPATVAYQDGKYPLKITRINPEIKDRQFDVDMLFTRKQPENIRIGKSYRVQIEMGQAENAIVVERGNFFHSTGGQWIFRLNESGDKAVRINISIGRQNPRQYEIREGLRPGDRVIISGYDNFGDAEEIILK
ncbi:MAG: HlyD family efflux transporter periplasmic adaptor subunit [Dysgonamonadaceae bacterium]|jgi:multidrug efflux pump subunit AcrA (membrane-fusion protein)|nr:HlyD family efflux transporter periplasmic adaptor subunit [Dysgonamonadaceae bacterium]